MELLNYKVLIFGSVLLLSACASTLENYQSKADAGDVNSQFELGISYFYGTKDIPENKKLAIKYLTLASDNGNMEATFNLGRIYEKEGDFDKAIFFYERGVENNNLASQDNLANMYLDGRGVSKNLTKAEALYLAALSNGSKLSNRNLAVLYKEDKQYEKSIKFFKEIIFSATDEKYQTYNFKKLVSLEIMGMNFELENYQEAYVWGSVAVLAGVFDSNIDNGMSHLEKFEKIADKLDEDIKDTLSKSILEKHYKAFQQYEAYFSRNEGFKSEDGVVVLPNKTLIEFTGYMIAKNSTIIKNINYYETKDDMNSKINLAIYKLKLSSSYISLGSIVPSFGMAKSDIEEATLILNESDNSNLDNLKKNIKNKLYVLEKIQGYQSKVHNSKIKI